MNDANILRAIETLHIRFMENPTERGAQHIWMFFSRSICDLTPSDWAKLLRYIVAIEKIIVAKFSPKSLAHLQTVAEEIF